MIHLTLQNTYNYLFKSNFERNITPDLINKTVTFYFVFNPQFYVVKICQNAEPLLLFSVIEKINKRRPQGKGNIILLCFYPNCTWQVLKLSHNTKLMAGYKISED